MFNHVDIDLKTHWKGSVSTFYDLPSSHQDQAIMLVINTLVNGDFQKPSGFYQYIEASQEWAFIPANTLIGLGQHVFQGVKGDQGAQLKIEGTSFLGVDDSGAFANYLFTFSDGSTTQIQLPIIKGRDGANGYNGVDGQNGVDGVSGRVGYDGESVNWLGTLSAPPSAPEKNMAYRDGVTGVAYIYTGTYWEIFTKDGERGTTGLDGFDGISGDYVEYIYSYSSEVPEGGSYDDETGFDPSTLTAGWYDDPYDVEINRPDDTYLDKTVYISKGRFRYNVSSDSWKLVNVWTKPLAMTGKGVVKGVAFARSLNIPTAAIGGDFNSPNPTNTSVWSDGIPTGTLPLWMTTRIFTSNGSLPEQAEWTPPQLVANTSDVKTEFSVDGKTGWQEPFDGAIYMRTCTSADGGATWQCTSAVKVKGEKGDLPTVRNIGGGEYEIIGQDGSVVVRDGFDALPPKVVESTDSQGRKIYIVTTYDHLGNERESVTVTEPLKNVDYYDGVTGNYVSFVYKNNSTTRPPTPVGGQVVGTTETPPSGWTDNPIYGENDVVWVSKTTYTQKRNSNGSTYWVNDGWSTPTVWYQRGEQGEQGISINRVEEHFALSSNGNSAPSSGWVSTGRTPTESYPYLWNRTRVYTSESVMISETFNVVANYSADGRGILKIDSYYKRSNSSSAPSATSSGWYSSAPSLTSYYKYLWNKEVIYFTDGTTDTKVRLAAQRGDDGIDAYVDASVIETEMETGLNIDKGGIQFRNGGWIKSRNATTRNGVFMGHQNGNYQFWAGNNNHYIHWDGSRLSIKGDVTVSGVLTAAGVGTVNGTKFPYSYGSSAKSIYSGGNTFTTNTFNRPTGANSWDFIFSVTVTNYTGYTDAIKNCKVKVTFDNSNYVYHDMEASGVDKINVTLTGAYTGFTSNSTKGRITVYGVGTAKINVSALAIVRS